MFYVCSLPNSGEPGEPKELFTDDAALVERFVKAEDRPGRGVYECINPLVPGARHRNLGTVAELRFIYFDLDLQNIDASRDDVIARLQQLPVSFVWVRDSGSGNLHVGIEIKDPPPRETAEYDRIVAVWKSLAEKLAADPAPVHPAALIRRVGTHNTKNGASGECRQLWNGGGPLDFTELEELDELLAEPLLTRKAKATNGPDRADAADTERGPVDLEAELEAMAGGKSVNAVHIRIVPSLLRKAEHPDDVMKFVVDETMTRVGKRLNWSRDVEVRAVISRILSAYNNLLLKDYDPTTGEIPPWLPGDFHERWTAALAEGGRPSFRYNRHGFYLRTNSPKGEAGAAETTGKAEAPPDEGSPAGETPKAKPTGWNYFDSTETRPQHWLVKQLLPETGVGIVSGQWGSFKTTAALDLSVAVMTGQPFAGQYRVKRPGAVLYFATEGAGTLQSRVSAIARHHGAPEKLPFAWRGDCPVLTDKDAGKAIVKHVDEAAAHFEHTYGVPIVLIWVDTYITAAGLSSSGDDNDTAATQKAFNTLRFVAAHSGAFVAVIDHLGKVIEAGTRGSSGKEGNADTVLATLAEREITGAVSNSRMAARKQRDGISGFEVPFVPETVELGLDEDGDPVTAIVLSWGRQQRETTKRPRRTKDRALLAKTLVDILAAHGFAFQPEPGGPTIRACHGAKLRAEFYRRRSADGTPKQQADKKRNAFDRALKATTEAGLVLVRNANETEIIWARQ